MPVFVETDQVVQLPYCLVGYSFADSLACSCGCLVALLAASAFSSWKLHGRFQLTTPESLLEIPLRSSRGRSLPPCTSSFVSCSVFLSRFSCLHLHPPSSLLSPLSCFSPFPFSFFSSPSSLLFSSFLFSPSLFGSRSTSKFNCNRLISKF